jgi:hypothetical protein
MTYICRKKIYHNDMFVHNNEGCYRKKNVSQCTQNVSRFPKANLLVCLWGAKVSFEHGVVVQFHPFLFLVNDEMGGGGAGALL